MKYGLTEKDIQFLRSIPQAVETKGKLSELDHVVAAMLVALLSDGHILLESNPGLGKTALVKAISNALGLGPSSVGRIQFTPDLMPSDITGTLMPDEVDPQRLTFKKGPIFSEILLADEINRATPKTQAAMLEAMAEFRVTVLGQTYELRHPNDLDPRGVKQVLNPFMVLATQNPIDQDGTFDLPEAQLDRFMFKVKLELPSADTLDQIVEKELSNTAAEYSKPRPAVTASEDVDETEARLETLKRLESARRGIMSAKLPEAVSVHIMNIVMATNGRFDQVRHLSSKRQSALNAMVAGRVEYPLGTRAAISLAKATLGWAAVVEADPSRPDEFPFESVAALARVICPVLRHRIRIDHEMSDTDYSPAHETQRLDDYLKELAVAAAPDLAVGNDPAGYHLRFKAKLDATREMGQL